MQHGWNPLQLPQGRKQILTLMVIWLLVGWFFVQPASALAHSADANPEQITVLLENEPVGDFVMTLSQYATAETTEVALLILAADGVTMQRGSVEMVAFAAETGQTITTPLIRHIDGWYVGWLPQEAGEWQVTVTAANALGQGSAVVTTIPFQAPAEASTLVRGVVLGFPFVLVGLAFVFFRQLNIPMLVE